MRRCDPEIFSTELQSWETDSQVTLGWQQDVTGARFLHAISIPSYQGTAKRHAHTENLHLRMLCHMLINRMPERGLPELCESLGSMYEFYMAPIENQVPALPERRQLKGKIRRAYERPEFSIADE